MAAMPVEVDFDDLPIRPSGPRHVYGSTNVTDTPLADMPVCGIEPRGWSIGRVVGDRYELAALIGKRPFGTAYRGIDRTAPQVHCAGRLAVTVMQLDPGAEQDAGFLRRLRSATDRLRRLEHPSLDAASQIVEEDGAVFVISRYRTGRTLADLLGRTAGAGWPLRTVLPVGHRLAEALEHAHSAGVVHGALDTASVLLTADDEAVLTDLGLHAARANGGADTKLDVLGLARLILAMLTGGGTEPRDGPVPRRPAGIGETAWARLLEGLASDPALRPATTVALIVSLEDPGWSRRLVGRRSR